MPADPAPSPPAPASTHLALGDSVAAGVGAGQPETQGYVPVLAGLLAGRTGCATADACRLAVRNLAVPGATTGTVLQQQVPAARELLAGGDVRLVTVTVGGNDVFVPVVRACARSVEDPACPQAVTAALRQADAGLDALLGRLTDAAGPGTPVAVSTYYDPLPACRLASLAPLAEEVLEGTGGQPGLNDLIRARAEEHGAVSVETAGRLEAPDDFVGGLDCLHPSTSGHVRIARAFLDAVGGRVATS